MYYFIVNPGSRSGNGKLVWQAVEQLLEQEQIEYHVYFTAYRYHAIHLVQEILAEHTGRITLVAVGGDGTVNEVLNGITDFSRVTFGYIPTGSSNDFARSLGLPGTPEAALSNILHPKYLMKMDLGQVTCGEEAHYFAVGCGCGFDAAVCHEALRSKFKDTLNHLKLGKLTYVGIALKQLIMMRMMPITVILDGRKKLSFPRTFFATAMNCCYEGGGLKFCPKAKPTDGLFDFVAVNGLQKWQVLFLLPLAYKGWHTPFKCVHIYRAKEIEVQLTGRQAAHTDGEPYYFQGSVKISCIPQLLTMIAAKPAAR